MLLGGGGACLSAGVALCELQLARAWLHANHRA